jgi:hypothetical protein
MSKIETEEPQIKAQAPPRFERKATVRLGQRELSRITLAVVLLVLGTLAFGVWRVFKNFKAQRDVVIATTNLHALYNALSVYSEDWDSRLPLAETWTDAATGFLSAPPGTPGGKMSYLHGPGDGETVGYVYNDLAAGYNLRPTYAEQDRQKEVDPGRLVLLIERPGAKENAHVRIPPQDSLQGEQALAKELSFPHYADDTDNAMTVVLFADGTIRRFTRRDFKQ